MTGLSKQEVNKQVPGLFEKLKDDKPGKDLKRAVEAARPTDASIRDRIEATPPREDK